MNLHLIINVGGIGTLCIVSCHSPEPAWEPVGVSHKTSKKTNKEVKSEVGKVWKKGFDINARNIY